MPRPPNKFSPTIIVAAITSQTKAKLPTHVELAAADGGLSKNSVVLLERSRTMYCADYVNSDFRRQCFLKEHIGTLSEKQLPTVDQALSVSLGITEARNH